MGAELLRDCGVETRVGLSKKSEQTYMNKIQELALHYFI